MLSDDILFYDTRSPSKGYGSDSGAAPADATAAEGRTEDNGDDATAGGTPPPPPRARASPSLSSSAASETR